jgi:hypothetical protein
MFVLFAWIITARQYITGHIVPNAIIGLKCYVKLCKWQWKWANQILEYKTLSNNQLCCLMELYKEIFERMNTIKSTTGLWNSMTFKKKMLDSKIFITSYTERGIVIREEIKVGNYSVSNSASKKNCLIMAVWQRWWHIKTCYLKRIML